MKRVDNIVLKTILKIITSKRGCLIRFYHIEIKDL